MRKLIVSNILSLDGYYEGPGKNVMALFDYRRDLYPMDESFDAYNAERLRAADTLLLGRNTRIISRAEAHEQIAELKGQVGRDVLVFGSRTLWNDLLANDLVDELHLMIGPVVLGAGTPVFDEQPAVTLRLIDTRMWDGSGNVLLRYEVHRQET